MFTGIIEEVGIIKEIRSQSGGVRLTVGGKVVLKEMKIGDSIAINGACLTATEIKTPHFSADVSRETLDKTNLGKLKPGDKVNLERPLRLSDRLGGHLVAGHVDGIGIIRGMTKKGDTSILTFEAPKEVMKYLVYKGSIAIDGISLTVNDIQRNRFNVTIIPHTARTTTLGIKKIGEIVNLEVDLIGKYVENFLIVTHADEKDVGTDL